MKKSKKSFSKFLESVESRVIVEHDDFAGVNLSTIDYAQRYALLERGAYREERVIRADNGSFFYGRAIIRLCRKGRNIFPERTWSMRCWNKNGKFHLEGASTSSLFCLFKDLGAGWWPGATDAPKEFGDDASPFFKPAIVKAILTGAIYNEETLWKAVAKRCYHIECPWRLFRDLYTKLRLDYRVSIMDVKDFTKSFEKSARAIVDADGEMIQLMGDVLKLAVALNEKVDLSWSEKRLHAHHQEQVRRRSAIRLDESSDEVIYGDEEIVEADGIRMLRSERDVFVEASSMSHCLWTNYWSTIKERKMLAFHLHHGGEDSTFSVYRGFNGKVMLDQIRQSHNRAVSKDSRDYALAFISANDGLFSKVLRQDSVTDYDLPF